MYFSSGKIKFQFRYFLKLVLVSFCNFVGEILKACGFFMLKSDFKFMSELVHRYLYEVDQNACGQGFFVLFVTMTMLSLPFRLCYRFHCLGMAVAGQMVMKIWSQVIMDFQEIQMKEMLSSSAVLKLSWYVLALSRQFMNSVVHLLGFHQGLSENIVVCQGPELIKLQHLLPSCEGLYLFLWIFFYSLIVA